MLELRTITADEIPAWWLAMQRGFHGRDAEAPTLARLAVIRSAIEPDRTRAAVDGGCIVATLRSITSDMSVPGGALVPAALLTQVTVAPTHRRRGILTNLLTADLRDAADRGDHLSYLVAAEYPIYGRFGYGPATERCVLTLDATARFQDEATGEVRFAEPTAYLAGARGVYEALRRDHPGRIRMPDVWWQVDAGVLTWEGGDKPWVRRALLHGADGSVRGYLQYEVDGEWGDGDGRPKQTCHVDDLHGLTPADEARLWRFCAEIDWVVNVEADRRSVHDPLRWYLHDARTLAERRRMDFTWLRVLRPEALAERRYAATGRLVLAVDDPLGILPATLVLDAGPDGASCVASPGQEPDVRVSARELGALYLGGTSWQTLGRVGRIEECRAGALAAADALFQVTVPPSCITMF